VRKSCSRRKVQGARTAGKWVPGSITVPTLVALHGTAAPVLTLTTAGRLAMPFNLPVPRARGMGHEIQPHYVAPISSGLLHTLARGDAARPISQRAP